MRHLISILLIILVTIPAQEYWQAQNSGTDARFRGVSAVNGRAAWASGTKGTFSRTTDGGKTWQAGTVPGAEELDFRDVEAISVTSAFLLSIGPGENSRIYKTTDSGKSWSIQFRNTNPKAFFDAMAFWDEQNGLAFSDPVDGRFVIIVTNDGGKSWKEVNSEKISPALPGEAAFAASGTCLVIQGKTNAWIGTGGGPKARVLRTTDRGTTWHTADTPIRAGSDSSGIFSLAFRDALNGIAVGGDYKPENRSTDNIAVTSDGGRTWNLIKDSGPGEYRSAVAWIDDKSLVAVGPSGSDYSTDGGLTWKSIGKTGFHAFSFSPTGRAGWAAGDSGRIAKFTVPQ